MKDTIRRMWLRTRLRLEGWGLLSYTPHVAPGLCPRCELIIEARPWREDVTPERCVIASGLLGEVA